MHRPKLTVADMWEAALVVLVIGAGAFLLSGIHRQRHGAGERRMAQQACLMLASPDPGCAPLMEAPQLQEGRAAGRAPIELLIVSPTPRPRIIPHEAGPSPAP